MNINHALMLGKLLRPVEESHISRNAHIAVNYYIFEVENGNK